LRSVGHQHQAGRESALPHPHGLGRAGPVDQDL